MTHDQVPVRVAGWALITAAVCYTAWVLGPWLNPGIDERAGYVSAYSASDQPHRSFFAAMDSTAGVLIVLAVLLVVLSRPGRWTWPVVTGFLGLAVLGAGTVADMVFSLDCTPYEDTTCALLERAGNVSMSHDLHTVTSSVAVTGGVAGMIGLSLGWRLGWGWVLATVEVVAVVGSLAAMLYGDWMGVAQRVQVGTASVFLAALGFTLLRTRTTTEPSTVLHVVEEGSGTPEVVFSSGLGEAWFDWDPVVALLDCRTIRFDRPGLGLSEPEAGPVTLEAEAARLAALTAGRPVVVAHSQGGFYAEAFARLHPDRIGGLVLVDPSCEPDISPRATWHGGLLKPVPALTLVLAAALAPLAGPALRNLGFKAQTTTKAVPGTRRQIRQVYGSGRTIAATAKEFLAYRDVAAELLSLRKSHPMPDIPVVVLTALGDADDKWRVAHADLAAELNGRQIVFPDGRHMLHVDQPEAVVAAIREVST
ncbi:alpha/beta fold hydrolase [Longispora albida]|uniref:alpha/beta fold hydrolase n=1 Tax=Longispora albida TaxID=203523 RepID=UPI0003741F02|nr:alpha/beta fold hydrolase [Longispora albida]